jgi:hypothetical protein
MLERILAGFLLAIFLCLAVSIRKACCHVLPGK